MELRGGYPSATPLLRSGGTAGYPSATPLLRSGGVWGWAPVGLPHLKLCAMHGGAGHHDGPNRPGRRDHAPQARPLPCNLAFLSIQFRPCNRGVPPLAPPLSVQFNLIVTLDARGCLAWTFFGYYFISSTTIFKVQFNCDLVSLSLKRHTIYIYIYIYIYVYICVCRWMGLNKLILLFLPFPGDSSNTII